jgi:hypoxanthine phosphoribosyltransferase
VAFQQKQIKWTFEPIDLTPVDTRNRLKRELLISAEAIAARVNELGEQISKDYREREPILIGVLNGVVFFFTDLIRALSIPCKIDFVRAASYGAGTSSSGSIKVTKEVEISVRERPVIIIEDIVDTGLTLKYMVQRIKRLGPESVKICALIDKLERRDEEITLDYWGFRIEEGFLVGYGLDYNEQYRYLPGIYVLMDVV